MELHRPVGLRLLAGSIDVLLLDRVIPYRGSDSIVVRCSGMLTRSRNILSDLI